MKMRVDCLVKIVDRVETNRLMSKNYICCVFVVSLVLYLDVQIFSLK